MKENQTEPKAEGAAADKTRKEQQAFSVLLHSQEYGGESFGEYDTLQEAYEAVSRIALKCGEQRDGILREFSVVDSNCG